MSEEANEYCMCVPDEAWLLDDFAGDTKEAYERLQAAALGLLERSAAMERAMSVGLGAEWLHALVPAARGGTAGVDSGAGAEASGSAGGVGVAELLADNVNLRLLASTLYSQLHG